MHCNGYFDMQRDIYHPPTKLREGNVFTDACLPTAGAGAPGPRTLPGG